MFKEIHKLKFKKTNSMFLKEPYLLNQINRDYIKLHVFIVSVDQRLDSSEFYLNSDLLKSTQ